MKTRQANRETSVAPLTWLARLGSVLGTVALAVFVPAMAWASTGPGAELVEAARRRPRVGGGIFLALCCLVVVGGIVLLLVLMMRKRSRRR